MKGSDKHGNNTHTYKLAIPDSWGKTKAAELLLWSTLYDSQRKRLYLTVGTLLTLNGTLDQVCQSSTNFLHLQVDNTLPFWNWFFLVCIWATRFYCNCFLEHMHPPSIVRMHLHKLSLTCSKLSWELSSCGSDVFAHPPDALDGPLKSAVAGLLEWDSAIAADVLDERWTGLERLSDLINTADVESRIECSV